MIVGHRLSRNILELEYIMGLVFFYKLGWSGIDIVDFIMRRSNRLKVE